MEGCSSGVTIEAYAGLWSIAPCFQSSSVFFWESAASASDIRWDALRTNAGAAILVMPMGAISMEKKLAILVGQVRRARRRLTWQLFCRSLSWCWCAALLLAAAAILVEWHWQWMLPPWTIPLLALTAGLL